MRQIEPLEKKLHLELSGFTQNGSQNLREAMEYAVFPGGGRVRPRLGLEIVAAHGKEINGAVMGAAMAIELIHCASLVHDDMPCFDDADLRRGKPSVHRKFGESTALLVGDALIVAAFDVLAKYCSDEPRLLGPMVRILAESVGASEGLIAGQASETEPDVSISELHRKKTGALFEGMSAMAALAAGVDSDQWRQVGRKIGAAYQLADDLLDILGDSEFAGKPVGQDARNGRPSSIRDEIWYESVTALDGIIEGALRLIPPCPGRDNLAVLLIGIATRLCPPTVMPRDSGLMRCPEMTLMKSETSLPTAV